MTRIFSEKFPKKGIQKKHENYIRVKVIRNPGNIYCDSNIIFPIVL